MGFANASLRKGQSGKQRKALKDRVHQPVTTGIRQVIDVMYVGFTAAN